MRFFLVGSDSGSDSLRLITDTVFPSRRDALAFLSSETAAATLAGLDEEVFVVDLEAATPVLLVQHAPAVGSEVEADDEERAATEGDALEDDSWEAAPAVAEDEQETGDLAGALRRATGSLESEGIVAPESVGPEAAAGDPAYPTPFVPEPAAWPWDASSAANGEQDEDAAAPALSEVEPGEGSDEATVAVDAEPEDDPVDAAEAELEMELVALQADEEPLGLAEAELELELVEFGETVAEDALEAPAQADGTSDEPQQATYAFDALEEPSVDDAGLVPASEEPYRGKAVVMGEYDMPDSPVEPMGANGAEVVEIGIESVVVEESGTEAAAETADEEEGSPVELVPAVAASAEEVADEADDSAGYTCDDCVYVNTCPKHHESDPAACGSFQWKIA